MSTVAQRCVNNVRTLSADIVEKAKSGHPGAPMGCAPIAHVLYSKIMKYDPKAPKWMGRDRFVLSNGHASALLYSMLHMTGYDLPMAELQVRTSILYTLLGGKISFLFDPLSLPFLPLSHAQPSQSTAEIPQAACHNSGSP